MSLRCIGCCTGLLGFASKLMYHDLGPLPLGRPPLLMLGVLGARAWTDSSHADHSYLDRILSHYDCKLLCHTRKG